MSLRQFEVGDQNRCASSSIPPHTFDIASLSSFTTLHLSLPSLFIPPYIHPTQYIFVIPDLSTSCVPVTWITCLLPANYTGRLNRGLSHHYCAISTFASYNLTHSSKLSTYSGEKPTNLYLDLVQFFKKFYALLSRDNDNPRRVS